MSSFREFLTKLKQAGELVEIEEPVSLDQELPHILRELCYKGGPAVLFTNVVETPFKVAGNLFCSLKRLEIALNHKDPAEKIRIFLRELPSLTGSGISGFIKAIGDLTRLSRIAPRVVSGGSVHEEDYTDLGLSKLPAVRQWPKEPARFFTMGITFVGSEDNLNFGYYRLQILDDRTFIMHWMPWRRSREIAETSQNEVDVAVVFGADPVTMLMASVPVPPPLNKALITSIVRGESLKLTRGKHVNTLYPSDAELVIEAKVKLNRLALEGTFGDHLGFYSPVKQYPVCEVVGIYGRKDPVVPVTVTGKPVLEDGYMILFGERVVLPLLQQIAPEVIDLHILPESAAYITVVSIRKKYPGQAKRVMLLLWALVPLINKIVVVVDHDVDVRNIAQVLHAIAVNVDPKRDILIVPDYATEELDPSTPTPGIGSKLGIDATRKLPEEYLGKEYPEEVRPDPEIVRKTAHLISKILDRYRGVEHVCK